MFTVNAYRLNIMKFWTVVALTAVVIRYRHLVRFSSYYFRLGPSVPKMDTSTGD